MQPVKIGGLTLKSEPPKEVVGDVEEEVTPDLPYTGEGWEEVKESLDPPQSEEVEVDVHTSILAQLILILTRVEELDKTDNVVKAIGKIKGAIELLN